MRFDCARVAEGLHPPEPLGDPSHEGGGGSGEGRRKLPPTFVASFADDDAVADMFASGACGFLLKSTRPAALADAIRAAHAGLALIPPDTIRRWSHTRAKPSGPTLTERERHVLTGLGQGLTNRDIARTMFVSPSTVKNSVSSLMRKLDAPTRTGVVARAHELGLLSTTPSED